MSDTDSQIPLPDLNAGDAPPLGDTGYNEDDNAARIAADLEADLKQCKEITLEMWRGRPVWEKLIGTVAWILERQQ